MRKLQVPTLSPEILKRLDEEYLRGDFDKIECPEIPPLDPATDPFGMNFKWLEEPNELETEFSKLVNLFPSEILRQSENAFRAMNSADSYASGSNRELFHQWIIDRFIPLCRSKMPGLIERISSLQKPSWEITNETILLIRNEPGFDALKATDQLLIAFAAIDRVRELHHTTT